MRRQRIANAVLLLLFVCVWAGHARAQKRDPLNEKEIDEMRESLKIVEQAFSRLADTPGPVMIDDPKIGWQAKLSVGPDGIVCLTGVSSGARAIPINLTALNKQMVLENNVVFGAVNANLRHYRAAVAALARAERRWLAELVSRRVPLERWQEALARGPGDVKPVIVFG